MNNSMEDYYYFSSNDEFLVAVTAYEMYDEEIRNIYSPEEYIKRWISINKSYPILSYILIATLFLLLILREGK